MLQTVRDITSRLEALYQLRGEYDEVEAEIAELHQELRLAVEQEADLKLVLANSAMPVGLLSDGGHITVDEIVEWAEESGLLLEARVRLKAYELWDNDPLRGRHSADYYWTLARRIVAVLLFLEKKKAKEG